MSIEGVIGSILGVGGIVATILTWRHSIKRGRKMSPKKRIVKQNQRQTDGEVQIQKQHAGDVGEIQGQRGGKEQEQSQEVQDDG